LISGISARAVDTLLVNGIVRVQIMVTWWKGLVSGIIRLRAVPTC
jgi:hypothetical protein